MDKNLVVEMRARDVAGRTDVADNGARFQSRVRQDAVGKVIQMPVSRLKRGIMLDPDIVAIAAAVASFNHAARRRCTHRRAGGRREINAMMFFQISADRVTS